MEQSVLSFNIYYACFLLSALFILFLKNLNSTNPKPTYSAVLKATISPAENKNVKKVPINGSSSFSSLAPKITVGSKSTAERIINFKYLGFS